MSKLFADLIIRIKRFPKNFKRQWQRQDMAARTVDLVWNALIFFAMTQVILGLTITALMVFVSMGYLDVMVAGAGSAFLVFIFEILCAIFIIHEFNTDSRRYQWDRIEQNTDAGVMNQLRQLLDELEKKNGLS